MRLSDFMTGKAAKALEPCKIMALINLFDSLAIDNDKQRRAVKKEEADPKKDSKGIAAFFNKEAAELLVPILRVIKASNRMDLFTYNNKYYYDLWPEHGTKYHSKGLVKSFRLLVWAPQPD